MPDSTLQLLIAVCLVAAVTVPLVLLINKPKDIKPATDSFQKWLRDVERYAPKSVRTPPYMYLVSLGVFVGVWLWLGTPAPAILAAAFVVLVPDNIAFRRTQIHRERVLEQLTSAARIFAGEFAATSQIDRGLRAVGRRVPDPVGKIFRKAHAGRLYGHNPDEVYVQMIKELNSPYGHMFVQILRAAETKGAMTAPLFHELVSRITVAQNLKEHNKSELSADRAVGLLLTVAPLPLYFLLTSWLPHADQFFAETMAGQTLITLCFVSAITWFFVDRAVSKP